MAKVAQEVCGEKEKYVNAFVEWFELVSDCQTKNLNEAQAIFVCYFYKYHEIIQVLTVLPSRRYQCVYIAIRLYTEILKSSDHISIGVFKCESVINGSELRVIRSNKSLDFSLHNILASAYTITMGFLINMQVVFPQASFSMVPHHALFSSIIHFGFSQCHALFS